MSSVKEPGWKRAAQIGLGILAIIVSGAALFFHGLTVISLVLLLAVGYLGASAAGLTGAAGGKRLLRVPVTPGPA